MRKYWDSVKDVLPVSVWCILLSCLIIGVLVIVSTTGTDELSVQPITSPLPTATSTPIVVRVPAEDTLTTYAASNLYAEAGVVTELDYAADVVTFMDARGMCWSFYGVEDWQVGDLLCAILYDAGTLDPLDDAVIGATYHAGAY